MSHALLDEETLETLAYERSKSWANMMKRCGEIGDGEELDFSDMELLYKREDRDPDVQEDEEAAEDDLMEEDLDMGNINTKTAMSKAELTILLCAGENKEKTAEMEEILNQTMPIVQEHKRKWKAAGLDKILDTFDAQKIEKHVGQWMRRNNSQEKSSQRYDLRHDRSNSDSSDSESLHSVETARYIMQSRQRSTPISKVTNMSTIKMYRTHSCKRDELRAKYAYDDEQEHRHHMQALLHRRRERERKLAYLTSSPRHFSHSSSRSHNSRHKHLRKRRVDSSFFGSPSSEDEDTTLNGCDCRSCLRRVLTRSAYEYCSYRGQLEYHPQSASSRSMHRMRRQNSFQEDLRPRLMENECSCCNSDRLCSNVVHIANTSTEEWVVENCNSPVLTETPTKCSNLLKCVQKHFTVRKTPQTTVRSKCRDRGKGQSPHKFIKKSAPLGASHTPRRQRTHHRHLIAGDTSDEDERLERRKPLSGSEGRSTHALAISSAQKAPKKKAILSIKSTSLPPITEIEAKTKNVENERQAISKLPPKIEIVVSDSSDEKEFLGKSRLMSFSEQKEKKVAENIKAVKTSKQPIMSSAEKAPKKKAVLSGKSKSLPPITEIEAKTKNVENERQAISKLPPKIEIVVSDSSDEKEFLGKSRLMSFLEQKEKKVAENIKAVKTSKQPIMSSAEKAPKKKAVLSGKSKSLPPISEDKDVAKSVKGLTPDVGRIKSVSSEDELKKKRPAVLSKKTTDIPEEIVPNNEPCANGTAITGSEGDKKIGKTPRQKRLKPKSAAKKKDNLKEVVHSPDSQFPSNEHPKLKIPLIKLKRCFALKNAEAASAVHSDEDIKLKRNGQNTMTFNDTEEEMEHVLALSKETYSKEQLKRRADQKTKANLQSTDQTKKQSPLQSLFHNNSVACNSTALVNDTACTRALSNKLSVKKRFDVSSSEQKTKVDTNIVINSATENSEADCTVVTSTTSCETKEAKPPPLKITKRGILLHRSSSSGTGKFNLTELDLGRIIGERRAKKYLKYHIGTRSFDSRHSVYYRPTPKLAAALSASPDSAQTLVHDLHTSSSSCSSEDDIFEHIQRYGEVYSVLGDPTDD
ncbi:uncharacterized protein LOC108154016 [Drosophila miranda]|uniref:uncharacterized protein LOC108154016 n=1 Tax=Drosophila miranda TaxID=7229 RepID=UPI00143F817D|nr:uncharacterized protein LOC108154016 [Drosophila miranda]